MTTLPSLKKLFIEVWIKDVFITIFALISLVFLLEWIRFPSLQTLNFKAPNENLLSERKVYMDVARFLYLNLYHCNNLVTLMKFSQWESSGSMTHAPLADFWFHSKTFGRFSFNTVFFIVTVCLWCDMIKRDERFWHHKLWFINYES